MSCNLKSMSLDEIKTAARRYGTSSITDVTSCEKIHEVCDGKNLIKVYRKCSHIIVVIFLVQQASIICLAKILVPEGSVRKFTATHSETRIAA